MKRWTITRENAAGAGPGLNWYDDKSAAIEALRALCARNPGIRYVVLEVVATAMQPTLDIQFQEV